MKIAVDSVELFELTDIQKQVIMNDINSDIFEDEMKQRLQWVLIHKYEQCFKRLKAEWDNKLLANNVKSVPTDPNAYAALVFSQPNYEDRKERGLVGV